MPLDELTSVPEAKAVLPARGYARTRLYDYLRTCERFGVVPWGGQWGRAEEAVLFAYGRVREEEESR